MHKTMFSSFDFPIFRDLTSIFWGESAQALTSKTPIEFGKLYAATAGTDGNDILSGTPGDDILNGFGGSDIL